MRRHAEVAARAGHRCEYCLAPESVFNFPHEVEHITPTSRGGTDAETNLALACRSCNLFKAAHLTGVDPETEEEVRLFHPRAERWHEHFEFQTVTGEICGLTPAGRATAIRLELNRPRQVMARRQWMRLGLLP